jgi:hypothetical protein
MTGMAAVSSSSRILGQRTDSRASIAISHTQPLTTEINVMLIHMFTKKKLDIDGLVEKY